MTFESLLPLAETLVQRLRQSKACVTVAESCTGGMVSAAITAIPGSSAVLDRSFVTYSNQAKTDLLAVPAPILHAHGAVSDQTAIAMAQGALIAANSDYAMAITGIAGPSGGSIEKPVGLVYFAWAAKGGFSESAHHIFPGDRHAVRIQAAITAMSGLLNRM